MHLSKRSYPGDPEQSATHEQLQASGLRVTLPRLALLDAVIAQGLCTTDELIRQVVRDGPRVSISSAYRALADLQWAGLVEKTTINMQGAARTGYISRRPAGGDKLLHSLVCSGCGAETRFFDPRLLDHLRQIVGPDVFGSADQPVRVVLQCTKCRSESPSRQE
jgi:Fe2+ or Zn2+ uptake regulation protein